jgi:hypothetical protein
MIATIYAPLNTKTVDRSLQRYADRLCRMAAGLEVLPARAQELSSSLVTSARNCRGRTLIAEQ